MKYGGLKFLEAAHVKDFIAGLRLLDNPLDEIAWFRLLRLHDGIGPARARALLDALRPGDGAETTPRRGRRRRARPPPAPRWPPPSTRWRPPAREPASRDRAAACWTCCGRC